MLTVMQLLNEMEHLLASAGEIGLCLMERGEGFGGLWCRVTECTGQLVSGLAPLLKCKKGPAFIHSQKKERSRPCRSVGGIGLLISS
jgi:hypothetical protein